MHRRAASRTSALLALLPLALLAPNAAASAQVPDDVAAAHARLAAVREELGTRADWEARAARVRRNVLVASGLDPLPERTELVVHRRKRRALDGYSVENVALEIAPGFFVTGNLYLPRALDEAGEEAVHEPRSLAGVLCPHGHFQPWHGTTGGRFRPSMQTRCATLARMGAAVFAYDMVGWGESDHTDHNADRSALAYQLWSSIRGLDFLCSLPEVDPRRLACTGASGGGSQTFLLAAVDERLAVSVPTVMVSAHFKGGCNCESGVPIHGYEGFAVTNVEIAALAAPRPQLLISCGGDWTKHTPEVELPFLRHVYGLLGAGEAVRNVHLAEEGHDYGPSKRAAMYAFLAEHLALRAPGADEEERVTVLPGDRLAVFDESFPRPEHSVRGAAACAAAVLGR